MSAVFNTDKEAQDVIDDALYKNTGDSSSGIIKDELSVQPAFRGTKVIVQLQRERNLKDRTFQQKRPVCSFVGLVASTTQIEFGPLATHEVDYNVNVIMDVFDEFEGVSANDQAFNFISSLAARVRGYDWDKIGIEYVSSGLDGHVFNREGRQRYSTELVIEFKYYICPEGD